MEHVRSSISIDCGLPCETVRSAPAIVVSGPAQRSLTLRPARSPSRLATLYIEGSDSFVASAAASSATGWSEPVPGRELHPLKSSAFSRRTFSPTTEASGTPRLKPWPRPSLEINVSHRDNPTILFRNLNGRIDPNTPTLASPHDGPHSIIQSRCKWSQ